MALGVEAKSKPSATTGARLFQTVNPAKGENGRAYEGHTIDQAKSIARDVYEAFCDDGEGCARHSSEPRPLCQAGISAAVRARTRALWGFTKNLTKTCRSPQISRAA